MIAVCIPSFFACFRSFCNTKGSGEVIFVSFVHSLSHIIILTVVNIKIFSPFSIKPLAMILHVEVFPFVPVTQIIFILLLGNQYTIFASIALIL
jgi:hypothetical protein